MVKRPKITFSVIGAEVEVGAAPQQVLVVGQKLAAGAAVAGQLVQSIQNDGSEDTYFGEKSMLAGMVRKFKKVNKVTRIDAIAVDDVSEGTKASGKIIFAGEATENHSLVIEVMSKKDGKVTVAVVKGDDGAAVATKVAAAVNKLAKLPVTAKALAAAVTFEAVHTGEEYNDAYIRMTGAIHGITGTITKFSGGAGAPDLTNLFSAIKNARYQTIIWPSSWDYSIVLADLLDRRWNVANDILDGVAISTKTDTLANLKTFGSAQNSKNGVCFAQRLISKDNRTGSSRGELNYIVSAHIASIRALRLTEDVPIGNYIVTTAGTLDAFGGPAIASLPYFNTPLDELLVVEPEDEWEDEEVDELNTAGISVIGNNSSNSAVILADVMTFAQKDAAGNEDATWKFLNSVDTDSNVREYIVNNLRKKYSQSRLSSGKNVLGRSVATKVQIEGTLDQYYGVLAGSDYALVSNGDDDIAFFKNNRNVDIDLQAGKATITAKYIRMSQLREIVGTLQASFTI